MFLQSAPHFEKKQTKISPHTAELLTNQMKQRAKQCIFHVNLNVLSFM